MCRLPSGKKPRDQLAAETISTLIDRRFDMLIPGIRITSAQHVVEEKQSQVYEISTQYVTTVFHAVLDEEISGTSDLSKPLIVEAGNPMTPQGTVVLQGGNSIKGHLSPAKQ